MVDQPTLDKIDAFIDSHLESFMEQLARLVAQPSVAAQNQGIEECAELVRVMLEEHGHTAEIMPSDGSPVVYAENDQGKDNTLLFYLHYDVQPADPFELWDSDPFTLTQRDGKAYGRGISDDKGHIIARLAAAAAVQHTMGELPCNLKFIIEGEEEVGSVNLPAFVEKHQEKLAADACVWEFGGVNDEGRPMQYLGLRGICYVELSVKTADIDAHSGLGGSIFPNAAWRLVWALNSLKDKDENILIPGYYDSVVPPTERDLEILAEMPDNSQNMLDRYKLRGGFLKGMEGGAELRREEVFVPTITICGLDSGYQDGGSKTVLPAEATAKVDFRLVPDQSPKETLKLLRAHLDAQGFEDVEMTFLGGGRPARTDPDHAFIKLVNEAASSAYGVDPVIAPMVGGSGPNYPFTHVLGLPLATCGIGYPGAQVHAPNENLVIKDFIDGIKHTARIIAMMGDYSVE